MIVALSLAGIIVTISVLGYQMIRKNFDSYNKSSTDYLSIVKLHQVLKQDFEISKTVRKTESGFICQTQTNSVKYKLINDLLIRNIDSVNDTMSFSIGHCMFLYKNIEQNITGELIDEVKIIISQAESSFPIHIVKWYATNVRL